MSNKGPIYLISNNFNYSKLITIGVSGPSVPEGFGWQHDYLSNISGHREEFIFIDCRISERECEFLKKYIKSNNTQIFGFFVVDPYLGQKKGYYFQTIFEVLENENVLVISRYQPRERTLDLFNSFGEKRFFVLPYPYLNDREIKNDFSNRKHRIIFSGSTSSEKMYPFRKLFWRKATRSFLRLIVDNLPHAGYWDVGQRKMHGFVKEAYIELLSSYKFMFLSPSRFDLELLKYSECAFAGCVPIGKSAGSLTDEMKQAFLELDFNRINVSTFKCLLKGNRELEQRASVYREAFIRDRDPIALSNGLIEFLNAYY